MSEQLKYYKVFILGGWSARESKQFICFGKTFCIDALDSFTDKQIRAFRLRIIFSRNFFGDESEELADAYIDKLKTLFAGHPVSELKFKGESGVLIGNKEVDAIVANLYQELSQYEKDKKNERKRDYV